MPSKPTPTNPMVDELTGLFARKQSLSHKSKTDLDNEPPQKRPRLESDLPFTLHGLLSEISSSTVSDLLLRSEKSRSYHPYLIPQNEDFSLWPDVTKWAKQAIHDRDLVSSFHLTTIARSFLRTDVLPHFEAMLTHTDFPKNSLACPKTALVAFVGLHGVLRLIGEKIGATSCEDHSVRATDRTSVEVSEVDEADIFEEMDVQSFIRTSLPVFDCANGLSGITPTSSRNRSFFGTRLQTPESTALLNSSDVLLENRTYKRRLTVMPDGGDAVNADESFAEEDVSDVETEEAEMVSQSSMAVTDDWNHFDVHDSVSEDFSDRNLFQNLCAIVQQHLGRFPVIVAPFVSELTEMYELCLKKIELRNSNVWDKIVEEEFTLAVDTFHRVVFEMDLAEEVIAPALQILCRKLVKRHIAELFQDNIDCDLKRSDTKYLQVLAAFIGSILNMDLLCGKAPCDVVYAFLMDYAKHEYISGVVDNFFDLLLRWPKSRPNFVELKELMDETSQDVIRDVIVSLRRQFHSKLLRPGLNTLDILAVYTAAIRALRVIDPSRVIQDLVCEPVRMYLRSRPDTVRCIMSHITHITSSRDANHRRNSLPALDMMIEEEEAAIALTMLNLKKMVSDVDMESWKTWQPDPVYAELLPTAARTDRQADTIELLMSIYGGQDVFINEYQLILAEKLLGYYPFDAEEESRHLKMMTKRFGEALLQRSEVMSRDAVDSQKFHERILGKLEIDLLSKTIPFDIPIKTLVISHNYWPEIRTEKVKIPAILDAAMVRYKKSFEDVSVTRTVDIRPELGHVQFELQLDDGRKMNVKCNPIYATIILQFCQQQKWTLDDLSEAVGVSPVLLKRKMMYWQRRHVLEESEPDIFSIVAEGAFLSEEDLRRMEDEEIESAVRYVAENNQDEQNLQMQLQMFWKYMVTMLNTVQTITIDRLFSMVRMFIIRAQTKKDVTIDHLRQFLDTKVRARELVYSNNRYSLPKKESKEKESAI